MIPFRRDRSPKQNRQTKTDTFINSLQEGTDSDTQQTGRYDRKHKERKVENSAWGSSQSNDSKEILSLCFPNVTAACY